LELAAVLGALGLLAMLALPTLANQRERSTRVLCVNNLRLVGQAFQQWGTEHGGRMPLRTPVREGGTFLHPLRNNAYFQWSWISNELRTPKILVCPSDTEKNPASNWGSITNGGFTDSHFRNRSVSYLMGLDVFPEAPDDLVAGDRNLRYNAIADCSSGLTSVPQLNPGPNDKLWIGDGLHVHAGNYLFTDGRVEELSNRAFGARWLAINARLSDNESSHYLLP
jgi:hypothetical protein